MSGYLHTDVAPKPEKKEIPLKKGPTVSQDYIERIIGQTMVHPFSLPEENPTMTVCYYTLPNGFTGVEYSACVSPENFDMEMGIQLCLDKIERKVWELEGYVLKQKIYEEKICEERFGE